MYITLKIARAAVVHLNFRAGSTFPVPVCMDRTSRCIKVDAVRLNASYRFNLLLLKGKRCVIGLFSIVFSLQNWIAHFSCRKTFRNYLSLEKRQYLPHYWSGLSVPLWIKHCHGCIKGHLKLRKQSLKCILQWCAILIWYLY